MTRLRLGLVLLFVLLPLVAARVSSLRSQWNGEFATGGMPARLDDHLLREEQPLQSDVLSMLVPKWYTMRRYADDAGASVWLYVAFYSGAESGGGAHDPAVCYPAQGWAASPTVERELAFLPSEPAVVKVLSATQGGREELVLYWFQPAGRWPAGGATERFMRLLDRLRGRPEYAFVRLSTQLANASDASRVAAESRLRRIASDLAPWVKNAVTSARN